MKKVKYQISKERQRELAAFQKSLGIKFKDIVLLNTALSHKSYVNEINSKIENNEKLEFLGDAFLGLVISQYLYEQDIYYKEGSLARVKSYVVSELTLYDVGKRINIQEYLLLGKGEEKSGGRSRKSLIGDGVEALIAAYYQDSGFKNARKFVENLFYDEIMKVEENRHKKDYKSILQEYSQKKFKMIPQYSVVNTEGPDHRRKFYVNVRIRKKTYGPGIGETKKQAEQEAAYFALSALKINKKLHDPTIEHRKEKGINRKEKVFQFVRRNSRAKSSKGDAAKRD